MTIEKLGTLSCPICGHAPLKENPKPGKIIACRLGHTFDLEDLLRGQRRVIRNRLSDLSSLIDEMKVVLHSTALVFTIKGKSSDVKSAIRAMDRVTEMQKILDGYEKDI